MLSTVQKKPFPDSNLLSAKKNVSQKKTWEAETHKWKAKAPLRKGNNSEHYSNIDN